MPYAYFTEHLVGVIEKSPRKRHEELGKLKSCIRWLKNKAGFHLQETTAEIHRGRGGKIN
jgi:hypothetical protein